MNTHIWWYRHGKGKYKRVAYRYCFMNIKHLAEMPTGLKYRVPTELDGEIAEFWVKFIHEMFGKDFKYRKSANHYTFSFETEGMGYGKILIRLTAMRHLYEESDVVTSLYEKAKDKPFREQFRILQQNHIDSMAGSSHGLIIHSSCSWREGVKAPISHEKFLKNLKDNKITTVFSHFL